MFELQQVYRNIHCGLSPNLDVRWNLFVPEQRSHAGRQAPVVVRVQSGESLDVVVIVVVVMFVVKPYTYFVTF